MFQTGVIMADLITYRQLSYASSCEHTRNQLNVDVPLPKIYCDQLSDISGIDLPASLRHVSTAERYDIFQNFENT